MGPLSWCYLTAIAAKPSPKLGGGTSGTTAFPNSRARSRGDNPPSAEKSPERKVTPRKRGPLHCSPHTQGFFKFNISWLFVTGRGCQVLPTVGRRCWQGGLFALQASYLFFPFWPSSAGPHGIQQHGSHLAALKHCQPWLHPRPSPRTSPRITGKPFFLAGQTYAHKQILLCIFAYTHNSICCQIHG